MKKKILIAAFDFPPNWGGVATYGWELAHEFHNLGYEVHCISKKRSKTLEAPFKQIQVSLPESGLLATPFYAIRLARLLTKENYDHIFCSLWLPDALAVYLAQKILRKKVPYSISVHAMEIMDSSETLKKRLRKKINFLKPQVFNQAEAIFCVSQFTANLVKEQVNPNASKLHVVANGANPEVFKTSGSKSPSPRLFSACRLISNKGVDSVIKALPSLKKNYPQIEYRISGEGSDRKRLEKLSEMMGVKEQVKFLGKIDLEQLKKEYSEAHLFTMLSRRERHLVEGFGLVFLEAALCGTASLGGDSGGIPDAIQNEKTGWLVDPYDQEAIERKINELLSEPNKLKEMGEQAKTWTLENRTWSHSAQKIAKILEGIQ